MNFRGIVLLTEINRDRRKTKIDFLENRKNCRALSARGGRDFSAEFTFSFFFSFREVYGNMCPKRGDEGVHVSFVEVLVGTRVTGSSLETLWN